MTEVIRSYMDHQIDNIQFDETLREIGSQTEDQTVRTAVRELWFHYDDCKEHFVVASKKQWDFFNRLLLLLASDAELAAARTWRSWHATQFVAAVALALFLCLAVLRGCGPELIALAWPFGIASMAIAWFNRRRMKRAAVGPKAALTPFHSFSSLRAVRRKAGEFTKIRYPEDIAGRTIRGPIEEGLLWIIWVPLWLMFSPIILFIQALPEKESESAVVMPEVG